MALKLLEDRERVAAYGAAGHRYCSEFLTADAAITAFERVIQDVASERHRP
jgi:hypothetical protein